MLLVCPQPSPTVCDALALWPCLYGECCKSGHFWSRVASVMLCDIRAYFITCQKSFCVTSTILLHCFHKMLSIFRGRRSSLDASIFMKSGRRGTLDVSCCAFFANRNVGAASSGHSVQIAWQASQFVTCDENWWKPRTKHRYWCSKFWGSLGELGEGNGDFVATLCDRHNTFASFSEDDFHFSWQAQHFGRVYHHFA